MSIHHLSKLREPKPLPALPAWAQAVLGELGLFDIGPVVGWQLWGRGPRTAVMMLDGKGTALNCCLSPSYPREGFTGHADARAWARAFFAGLGRADLREMPRRPRNAPASTEIGVNRSGIDGAR